MKEKVVMLSLINSKRWSDGTILVVLDSIELYVLVGYGCRSERAKQDTFHGWLIFRCGNRCCAMLVVSIFQIAGGR